VRTIDKVLMKLFKSFQVWTESKVLSWRIWDSVPHPANFLKKV